MRLPRNLIRAAPWPDTLRFDLSPVQVGLGGSPWHVAVASIMLCRVARKAHIIAEAFRVWPTPELMEASDVELEELLQPLGLQRQRSRSIQLLSRKWRLDTWDELGDLSGVGAYVNDAVGLFCFGVTDLASRDVVLTRYAASYTGPRLLEPTVEAYNVYRERLKSGA